MKNTIYEISSDTCAVKFLDDHRCIIIEGEREISIDLPLQHFINYNCEYYGSSFDGRVKGSQIILGMKYKLPIVISEIREFVFFPTKSYTSNKCIWISLTNILSYESFNNLTLVTFKSGKKCLFDISLEAFENQYLRATKLLLILRNRNKSISG